MSVYSHIRSRIRLDRTEQGGCFCPCLSSRHIALLAISIRFPTLHFNIIPFTTCQHSAGLRVTQHPAMRQHSCTDTALQFSSVVTRLKCAELCRWKLSIFLRHEVTSTLPFPLCAACSFSSSLDVDKGVSFLPPSVSVLSSTTNSHPPHLPA